MVSTSRQILLASAALAAGALLAGCSGSPGAAAVVNGERISETYLAEATAESAPYLNEPMEQQGMLSFLIQAPAILQVASENGVGVSAQEAVMALDELSASNGIETDGEYAGGTIDLVRVVLTQQRIQESPNAGEISAAITERIAEADVEVNPRYGEWDGEGAIAAVTPEWLIDSTPAAAPAAG